MALLTPCSKPEKPASANARLAAASSFDYGVLPWDMLQDVLLRLPAKPLCRLRAVSRSWRSLLSDRSFIAAHALCHPSPLLAVGVIDGDRNDSGNDDVSTVGVSILNFSGDVLKRVPGGACSRRMMRTHLNLACIVGESWCLWVVDPATGAVSFFPDHLHEEEHARPRLRWDQLDRSRGRCGAFALGRAASSGEYKVLRIRNNLPDQICEVLTLGDGSSGRWREKRGPPTTVKAGRRDMAVVKGIAYLLVDPSRRLFPFTLPDFAADSIASFDLATEQWTATLLRGPLSSIDMAKFEIHQSQLSLTVLDGCLAATHRNDRDLSLDLWFGRVENSKNGQAAWCRRYVVRYHLIFQMFYEDAIEPLLVLDNGRVVFWVWRDGHRNGVLRTYDPRDDASVDVVEMTNCVDVAIYTGNLLCLRSS